MTEIPQRRDGDGGRWWVLAALFGAAFVLGWCGFYQHAAEHGVDRSVWDHLYLTLQLFSLESGAAAAPLPWELELARFLAPLVTLGTVILAGLAVFRENLQSFRLGFIRNHVVICGLGDKGLYMTQSFRRRGMKVVVVELKDDNEFINNCRAVGAIVLVGNAEDGAILKQARVHRARYVAVTTEDDSANVEIASRILTSLQEHPPHPRRKPTCLVHIVDLTMCRLFKQHRIFTESRERVEIKVFNHYENSARHLFGHHLLDYCPVEPGDPRALHVLLVGFENLGQSLLLHLARMGHFANGRRTRISVYAPQAAQIEADLAERFSGLAQVCDVDATEGGPGCPATLTEVARRARAADSCPVLVFCGNNEHENFAGALELVHLMEDPSVPVFIRIPHAEGLAHLLHEHRSESDLAAQVEGFGLMGETCNREIVLQERLDRLAQAIHEEYRAERFNQGAKEGAEGSLEPWERLDEAYRESNRQAADHIPVKLRTFGYTRCRKEKAEAPVELTDEQIDTLARLEHKRWMAERLLAGWTYAPGVKDETRKTSPYITDWDHLPEDIKGYDADSVKKIPLFLERVGDVICEST